MVARAHLREDLPIVSSLRSWLPNGELQGPVSPIANGERPIAPRLITS